MAFKFSARYYQLAGPAGTTFDIFYSVDTRGWHIALEGDASLGTMYRTKHDAVLAIAAINASFAVQEAA